jgi:hypothetical protein
MWSITVNGAKGLCFFAENVNACLFEPVNAMPSSKTTVLGIRLDHERRAWVEAEAARHGVTIRAFFESMIDEARYEEALDQAAQDAQEAGESEWTSFLASGSAQVDPELEDRWSQQSEMAEQFEAPGTTSDPLRSLCDDLVDVVGIPGRLIRHARSVPGALIREAADRVRRAGRF